MSTHYPQGYRYRSPTKATSGEQGSDSDVAELSDLEDDEDEDGAHTTTDRRPVVGRETNELEDFEIDERQRRFNENRRIRNMDDEEDEDEDEEDDDDDEDDEDDDDDDDDDDEDDDDEDDEEEDGDELPYPGFVPVALRYLEQTTRPRNWCLALITNPYPFWKLFISMPIGRKNTEV
ncbi:hypothetical protein HZH66_003364 [Vespula vulgaris]|uniref:Voltage-dependent T-type calcium channel subunit alpha-1G n=1 Tax=Vespula vulgaris TaxID=7454 RepID=A0A834NGU6_VESVU|nr:hypothetical protein HZH66_003364 [Vespula vulgaris]